MGRLGYRVGAHVGSVRGARLLEVFASAPLCLAVGLALGVAFGMGDWIGFVPSSTPGTSSDWMADLVLTPDIPLRFPWLR